jgi:hypothetical protein
MAWRFSWLKQHRPCLTSLEPGLTLRKSLRSPSYLGLKPVPIRMVLTKSSVSICTALASSAALKASDKEGMVELVEEGGVLRHKSVSSVVAAASSMLFCL